MAKRLGFQFEDIHRFLDSLFGEDVHAKRVYSLANATLGVMSSASLAVHAIGQGLAQARGKLTKHAVKQVDRLLSNAGIEVWALFAHWVPYVVGPRKSIMVAMDWTDFDADGQATIMLSLLTRHGRGTPLLWLTVDKATLKEQRNAYGDRVLWRLKSVLPEGIGVTVVADRGFGDQKLYQLLEHELHFDFVIRFRGNIYVSDAQGETRQAQEWVGPRGRARTLGGASVTADQYPVGTVVCVHEPAMKEPWCLAASTQTDSARMLMHYYGKRWGVGVSSQGHIIQSVKVRPRPKDSGLVAWEAPWRESKTVEPSDNMLSKEHAQRTRLQRAVNAEVASLHATPVAETVDNARRQQGWVERSPMRPSSPAGYQRRHGVKDDVSTGEARGARRRKLAEEASPITVSGKWRRRHQGGGSGRSTDDGRAAKRARREGPGPVSAPLVKVRQG